MKGKNWITTAAGWILGISMALTGLGVKVGNVKTVNGQPIGYEQVAGAVAAVVLGTAAADKEKKQKQPKK